MANNEVGNANLVRLFPLVVIKTTTDWFFVNGYPRKVNMGVFGQSLIKGFGTDKLLDSPIHKLSTIIMRHSKNVLEYIERFIHIRHTCSNEWHITHIVTWFIFGLSSVMRREMKKASTYATLTEAYDIAMEIEDEYDAAWDDVELDLQVQKGKKFGIRGNLSSIQGSSTNIGAKKSREIVREVTKKNQEEVLQAIERKLQIAWVSIWLMSVL